MVLFIAKMWNIGRTETVTGCWLLVASMEIFTLSGPKVVCIGCKSYLYYLRVHKQPPYYLDFFVLPTSPLCACAPNKFVLIC